MKPADIDFLRGLEELERTTKKEKGPGAARIPPIQVVLTKADLVSDTDLVRRMMLTKDELRDALRREHGQLRIMPISAKPGVGFNNVGWTKEGFAARGGVLELQREIAAVHAAEPYADEEPAKKE
jgi:hypothetical protein